MTAALIIALLLTIDALQAALIRTLLQRDAAVVETFREAERATTALYVARQLLPAAEKWDALTLVGGRGETPAYDGTAVDAFREQLEEGRTS